jgi:hypothetical protein
MGKTQNSPIHIPTFLQKNDSDPAIKVSIPTSLIPFHVLISPM